MHHSASHLFLVPTGAYAGSHKGEGPVASVSNCVVDMDKPRFVIEGHLVDRNLSIRNSHLLHASITDVFGVRGLEALPLLLRDPIPQAERTSLPQ